MAYALKHGEKPERAIRRIVRQQIRNAGMELKKKGANDSIHVAREALKKARAGLRLIASRLGRKAYRGADHRLRAVANELSEMRDAEVLFDTLDKLSHGSTHREAMALAELRELLLERREKGLRASKRRGGRCTAELRAVRKRLKRLSLGKVRWRDLCRGLRRTYQRGAEAFHQAERKSSSETLHAWRKRVKDLRYQLQILNPIQPQALSPLVQATKLLGEQLGDDHDLALVESAAGKTLVDKNRFQRISKLVHLRRVRLQHAAFRLGERIYREEALDFTRRIKRFGKIFYRSSRSADIDWAGFRKFRPVAQVSAPELPPAAEFARVRKIRRADGSLRSGTG